MNQETILLTSVEYEDRGHARSGETWRASVFLSFSKIKQKNII